MKNYFLILLTAGIVGSIASVLTDSSSLGKYVKYISALVCVIIVITPLKSVFKAFSVSVSPPTETVYSQDTLTNTATDITEKQISEKIKEKFGITPTEVSINIDTDGKITLSVSLCEADEIYRKDIDEYISTLCK